MRSWFTLFRVVVVALFFSLPARADFPAVNTRRFLPPTDPSGSLYLEGTPVLDPGIWSGAAWFVYSYRPDVLRDVNGAAAATLVRHQLSSDLVASVGIVPQVAVGLDLPILLYQTGEDSPIARPLVERTPPKQALGDIGVFAKGNILAYGSLGGFGLSTLVRLNMATGNSASYLSEGMSTGEIRLLGEYKLVALSLQGSAGVKVRAQERDVLRKTYGYEVPWGVAVSIRPQAFGWDNAGRFTWVAEVHGSTVLAPSDVALARGQTRPASVAMAGLSARMAIKDFSVLLGVETALTQGFGAAPLQVVTSVQWSPRKHDADNDGVKDDVDQCPELAEDRDGIQDADGCPEFEDSDDDGVPDKDDQCPEDKEDHDDFKDDDGCPDPDNDEDGIIDVHDACPNAKGDLRDDPAISGCPDMDKDGLVDKQDKCPNQAEDVDGFQDADGCPDNDNDGDGVVDAQDKCPNEVGSFADPTRPGCPVTDLDHDTWEDEEDECPEEAENFNGIEDQDGCADKGGRPLVAIDERRGDLTARFVRPIRFAGSREAPEVESGSVVLLRALAVELNRHPNWIVAVGVRPRSDSSADQQAALAQSFAAVDMLRKFAPRDGSAETVGWKAVAAQPGAWSGFGVLVLAQPQEKPEEPPKQEAPKPGAPKPEDAPAP